jgi:hypothetical protein
MMPTFSVDSGIGNKISGGPEYYSDYQDTFLAQDTEKKTGSPIYNFQISHLNQMISLHDFAPQKPAEQNVS